MSNIKLTVNTKDEMSSLAKKISQISDGYTIFLNGNLGAGKTFFAKSFISSLCKIKEEQVDSPTFSICNEYFMENERKILHYDLYRIKNIDEIYEIGLVDEVGNTMLIEWSEIFCQKLKQMTKKWLEISIESGEGDVRTVDIYCDNLDFIKKLS